MMPRKMRRAALKSALSIKARDGEIVLLDDLQMDQPKTKELVNLLKKLTGSPSALILTAEQDRNVELSARNAVDIKALRANYLNIRDLLGHHKLVMPLSALDVITGNLGQGDAVPFVSNVSASAVETEEEE